MSRTCKGSSLGKPLTPLIVAFAVCLVAQPVTAASATWDNSVYQDNGSGFDSTANDSYWGGVKARPAAGYPGVLGSAPATDNTDLAVFSTPYMMGLTGTLIVSSTSPLYIGGFLFNDNAWVNASGATGVMGRIFSATTPVYLSPDASLVAAGTGLHTITLDSSLTSTGQIFSFVDIPVLHSVNGPSTYSFVNNSASDQIRLEELAYSPDVGVSTAILDGTNTNANVQFATGGFIDGAGNIKQDSSSLTSIPGAYMQVIKQGSGTWNMNVGALQCTGGATNAVSLGAVTIKQGTLALVLTQTVVSRLTGASLAGQNSDNHTTNIQIYQGA